MKGREKHEVVQGIRQKNKDSKQSQKQKPNFIAMPKPVKKQTAQMKKTT